MFSIGFNSESYGSCDCPGGAIVVDASSETLSTSSLPANSYSGSVCIVNGTFVIDDNYILNGANVYFEDFAQLEIENGNTLTITNGTKLEACSGMWESVLVQDGATLIMQNSSIWDSYHGVELEDGSSFEASNNLFVNNYISIYGSNGQIVNFEVHGNLFIYDQGAGFNYTVYNLDVDKPYAGIVLENVADTITIGSIEVLPNEFEGLNYGIRVINTNVIIDYALFRHIQSFTTAHEEIGIGVYAQGNDEEYYLEVKGRCVGDETLELPNGFSATYTMYNVHRGIVANSVHLKIVNQCMVYVNDGIEITNASGKQSTIRENEILAHHRGIYLHENGAMDSIIISTNVIAIVVWDQQGEDPGEFVIGEFGDGSSHEYALIEITTSRYLSTYGIMLLESNGWIIRDNDLSYNDEQLSSQFVPEAAFYLESCLHIELSCNTSSGQYYSQADHVGFYIKESPSTTMKCNYTHDHPTGVRFEGDCDESKLMGHMFGDHEYGLHYTEDAITGEQIHHGNLWLGTYIYHPAWHEGLIASVQLSFYYVPDEVLPYYPETPEAAGTWFVIEMNEPQNIECFEQNQCVAEVVERPGEMNDVSEFSTFKYESDEAKIEIHGSKNFLYPNPSTGHVSVQSAEMIHHIAIYDISGNTMLNETINDYHWTSSVSLQAGTYTLKLQKVNGSVEIGKFVIID